MGVVVLVFGSLLRDARFVIPAVAARLFSGAVFACIAMSQYVHQEVYGSTRRRSASPSPSTPQASSSSPAGSTRCCRGRVGPVRLLACGIGIGIGIGIGVATVAAAAMTVGANLAESPIALVVPLFVMVSCLGLILPNGVCRSRGRPSAAGSASALLGVIQFGVGAAMPPIASAAGVRPTVTVTTMLVRAVLAAVPTALLLRAGTAPEPVAPPKIDAEPALD